MSLKGPNPTETSAICNLLGSFSLFLGHFDIKNYASALYHANSICGYVICWDLSLYFGGTLMLKTMRPCYTAHKISAIRYLFGYFFFTFWALMGATECPSYTGFRSLLVCCITAP